MEDDAALFYGERREYPVVALPCSLARLGDTTESRAGPPGRARGPMKPP